jgi:hypothetical protein
MAGADCLETSECNKHQVCRGETGVVRTYAWERRVQAWPLQEHAPLPLILRQVCIMGAGCATPFLLPKGHDPTRIYDRPRCIGPLHRIRLQVVHQTLNKFRIAREQDQIPMFISCIRYMAS